MRLLGGHHSCLHEGSDPTPGAFHVQLCLKLRGTNHLRHLQGSALSCPFVALTVANINRPPTLRYMVSPRVGVWSLESIRSSSKVTFDHARICGISCLWNRYTVTTSVWPHVLDESSWVCARSIILLKINSGNCPYICGLPCF